MTRSTPWPAERGVALGLFCEDPGFSHGRLLSEISASGASHVSLVVPFYQRDISSNRVHLHPRFSPGEAAVRRAMRQARRAGLRVLLFPILRLEHTPTPDHWRGAIKPGDPATWWRSYGRMMLRWARLARAEGAASLCVGSELGSMDRDPKPWAALVKRIRLIFKGKILYSANWDGYRRTRIWSLVDRIGISAYFPLSEAESPSVEQLIHGWAEQRRTIERWLVQQGKPLVFTEVGYRSQRGAATRPWQETGNGPVDLKLQADAYRAFFRVWSDAARPDEKNGLSGVYIWNWFGYGGPRSGEYCPRGKPAAAELCRWYGARPNSCPTVHGLPGSR